MRKASILVGLTLVALAATSHAQEPVPAAATFPLPSVDAAAPTQTAAASQPGPSPRRVDLGLSILPMAVGKLTTPFGAMEATGGASFAYGFGLSANYRVIAGLSVGLAPQAIFHVGFKVNPSQSASSPTSTEYDLMARLAYTYTVVETIALYAEVLPGYSILAQSGGSPAKGLVLALGGGVAMGLTDRSFVNLGIGYQIGYQSVTLGPTTVDDRTKYVRVALGGGVRF